MARKTTKAPFDFKVGDWCKSYEKGFFRIEQIIPMVVDQLDVLRDVWAVEFYKSAGKEYQPRCTPDLLGASKGRMIISKRLLNSKFKKQIGASDCCGEEHIKSLTPKEKEMIEEFIRKNPKVMEDFERSKPKMPESRYGFSFELSRDGLDEKIAEMKAEARKKGDCAIGIHAFPINMDTKKLHGIAEDIKQKPLTINEFLAALEKNGLLSKMVRQGNVDIQGISFGEFRDGQIVLSDILLHGFSLIKELNGDLSV